MSNTPTLLPCPFDGSEVKIIQYGNEMLHRIWCPACHISVGHSKETAPLIEWWNTRTSSIAGRPCRSCGMTVLHALGCAWDVGNGSPVLKDERVSIAGVPATCVKCGHRATVNGICEVGMPERGKDEYGYNVKCGCKCGFPAVPAQRAAHDLAEKIVEYVNINDDYNADGITAIIEEECSRGIEEQAEQEQG